MKTTRTLLPAIAACLLLVACKKHSSVQPTPQESPAPVSETSTPTGKTHKHAYEIKRPANVLKVALGDDGVQVDGMPLFLPVFDSTGGAGGISANLEDVVLDLSEIENKLFNLLIAIQQDQSSALVKVNLTPAVKSIYLSPEKIVVPSQKPVVAANGPFITLVLDNAKEKNSAPLVNWRIAARQENRSWSGKTTASGFTLDNVDLKPIEVTLTNPSNGKPVTQTIYPYFRGGTPNFVIYSLSVDPAN